MMPIQKIVIAGLALGVLGIIPAPASAQAPTNPSILQAIQSLQATVNALAASVGDIKMVVDGINNAIPGEGNQLATAPVFLVPTDTAVCTVANVSPVPRTIQIRLVTNSSNGTSVSGTVQPGQFLSRSFSTGLAVGSRFFCTLTVLDDGGVKSDIRGALSHFTSGSDLDPIAAQ
jgi:hypothetical protein